MFSVFFNGFSIAMLDYQRVSGSLIESALPSCASRVEVAMGTGAWPRARARRFDQCRPGKRWEYLGRPGPSWAL